MKLLYLTPLMFLVFSVFNPDAIKDLNCTGGIPILEVAFLLFWTFTKEQAARIPHEWRHRVNFQHYY
jgi:hypothetical protein